MNIYLIWKLIHVIAAIVFIGNITTGIFWKLQADKFKDRLKILETFRILMKADRIFTMPSVIILIIFGIGAAMQGNFSLVETPWIFGGIILIIISTFAFMSKVVPIQKKIIALTSNEQKYKWEDYQTLSKAWNFWSLVGVISSYIAVVLMILKPI